MSRPYCSVCRKPLDMGSRHVEISANILGEDKPERESYRMHLDCWDSVAAGWGRP